MIICKKCSAVCTDSEIKCSNCGNPLSSISTQSNLGQQILTELQEQNKYLKIIAMFCKIIMAIWGIAIAIVLIWLITFS